MGFISAAGRVGGVGEIRSLRGKTSITEMAAMKQSTLLVLLLSLTVVVPPVATAQSSQESYWDNTVFIDGLARQGMGELLDRLATDKLPRHAVLDQLVEIGQLRIKFSRMPSQDDGRLAAFDKMAGAMRALIKNQSDHELRPLWQTDLAESLMLEKLAGLHQNAAEFCEFGVPTEDQRRAFSEAASEAVELLTDAELRFFQLQNELPREADHEAKRVANGLWDRMMTQYYQTRTPYLLARAAYFTGLLDDDEPLLPGPREQPEDPASAPRSEPRTDAAIRAGDRKAFTFCRRPKR